MVKALCVIAGILIVAIETLGQNIDMKLGKLNHIDRKIVRSIQADTFLFPLFKRQSEIYRREIYNRMEIGNLEIPPSINPVPPGVNKNFLFVAERSLFPERIVAPYIRIEQGRLFDAAGPGVHVLNSTVTRWGTGIQYKIRDNISLDVGVRYQVTEYFSGYMYMMGITIEF